MPFDSAGLTDLGRKREHNEDALLLAPEHGLFVVADGMGGHQAGEVASNLAIATVAEFFEQTEEDHETTWPFPHEAHRDEAENRLVVGLKLANKRIRDAARDVDRQGMGTTCVALHLTGETARFAWVGDSRGYLWRAGALRQVTRDHSLFNQLVDTGRIRAEDHSQFQYRNVITRALGIAPRVDVDVAAVDLQGGDILLACSDGLTSMVEDERIAALLTGEVPLFDACRQLVDAANSAGGSDNVTVLLVRYKAA